METPVLTVTTPLADAPIRDVGQSSPADGARYLRCLGPVLAHYPQLTVAGYWQLTSAEHESLIHWLKRAEILDGDEY